MNREKENKQKVRFEDALKKACEGIFYPSETDAEIVPFFGVYAMSGTRETILNKLDIKGVKPAEEKSFVEFFSRLTKIQDWFGAAEIKNAKRFLELQKLLEENLNDLTVLRTGRIQIDIYVVGVDSEGTLAGIKTKAVET